MEDALKNGKLKEENNLKLPNIFKHNKYFPLGNHKSQIIFNDQSKKIIESKLENVPINLTAVKNKFIKGKCNFK